MLRYNRDLGYEDFSDDLSVQNKLKRAETFRLWADIEDLASGFSNIHANFEQHRMTAANAFQELYQYIEKTKKELNGQVAGSAGAGVEVDITLLKRIERLESRMNLEEEHSEVRTYTKNEHLEPRIVKDQLTNQVNVEDSLIQYMDLLIALNAKLNNHVSSTKLSVRELENKIGLFQNLPPPTEEREAARHSGVTGTKFLEIETEVEKLKLEVI